jgi:glycosyltransferase involved in cell wall biosynthesis
MKLLFVHQNFPGQYRHIAANLAQQGHSVTALGVSERPAMPGIRYVRYLPRRKSSPGIHPWAVDYETKLIRGEACLHAAHQLASEGYQPDIICAHPGWGEALFLRELWPQVPQLHYVEFFYRSMGQDMGFDTAFDRPDLAARARLVAKNANNLVNLDTMDAGICPTQWQFSTLPSPFQSKVTVLHDGIDTLALRPNPRAQVLIKDDQGQVLQLKAGDPLITYVGRNLEPYRGYHQFMRALPRMLRECPEARAIIIGGDGVSYGVAPPHGTWKQRFFDEVREQLDLSRVHFVGTQPYTQFIQILQCSQVHVYLTYPFVLSWSLLEAMSLGAQVVASDTAPVREVIKHGENGWLVNFFDSETLAERVIQSLHEPSAAANIRVAARQTVVDRYDLKSHCLPQQLALIQQVHDRHRA